MHLMYTQYSTRLIIAMIRKVIFYKLLSALSYSLKQEKWESHLLIQVS